MEATARALRNNHVNTMLLAIATIRAELHKINIKINIKHWTSIILQSSQYLP